LHAEIAAGGMATVHVGRLMGPVGFARTVAIKRLHPHFAKDPEFVAMFLDEARLAARIRHPNVVPVLDVVAEGGELFLVMDYVEGESLSRLVGASRRSGHAPPSRLVAGIVAQALHGLHAAHEAKDERGYPLDIVHRDVSPQNVLVGTDGIARVLDFGVAKAVGRSSVTREGELKGKLPYMAPEQVRRAGTVTRRTDVYAAGVVLWEALAGKRLFEGDGEAQIMAAVLDGPEGPPSEIEGSVPRELDAIAMKALSRDPAERFATAEEMARAIEQAIGVIPTAEISSWVREMVAPLIAKRADAVAQIESSPGLPIPVTAVSSIPPLAPVPPPLDETATLPMVRTAPPDKRRRAAVVVALALLLCGAIAFLVIPRAPAPTEPIPAASAPPPPSASSAPPASSSSTPAPAPSVVALPPVVEPHKPPVVTLKPPKPPPKPGAGGCDPPYYYEGGIKKFKPNCL
jgi:serine/threonine-protein kinase